MQTQSFCIAFHQVPGHLRVRLLHDGGGHLHHGADEREDDQEPGKRCKTTEFACMPPNLGNDAWK